MGLSAPSIDGIWRRFRGVNIFIIVAFLVFGSLFTIKWVPNEYSENVTQGNTSMIVGKLYYSKVDRVPVRLIGENSFDHWSMSHVVGFTIFLIVVLYFAGRHDMMAVKTFDEGWQKIHDRLSADHFVQKFAILKNCADLQHIQTDDNNPQAFNMILYAEVQYREEMETGQGFKYQAFYLDPYTLHIKSIIDVNDIPDGRMKCPSCGTSPDLKKLSPEGYKDWKNLYK